MEIKGYLDEHEKRYVALMESNIKYLEEQIGLDIKVECYVDNGNQFRIITKKKTMLDFMTASECHYAIAALCRYWTLL